MNISGRISNAATRAAIWTGLGVVCLALLLTGLAFLIAGFYIWISHAISPAAGAAITGGGLLVLAILVVLIGGMVVMRTIISRSLR